MTRRRATQSLEVEAAVNAPGGLGQVAFSVLEKAEHMTGAIQEALAVAQHHVDPAGAVGLGGGLAGRGLNTV